MPQRIYTEIQAKSIKLPGHKKEADRKDLPLSYRDFSEIQYFHPSPEYTVHSEEAIERNSSVLLPEPLITTLEALEEEDSLKILLQWHMGNKGFWHLIEKTSPK